MKLRVWWVPQIGCNHAFYVPVDSVEEAKKVMDTLAAYDYFQLNHNIKSDYCNMGGLEMFNEETGEWEDWELENDDDFFDDVDEYIDSLPDAEKYHKFSKEIFKQVNFDD